MRNGYCQFWFEKLPEGRATGGKTSVDVCLRGDIVVPEVLVCARQRPPQFPLRPYNEERLPFRDAEREVHSVTPDHPAPDALLTRNYSVSMLASPRVGSHCFISSTSPSLGPVAAELEWAGHTAQSSSS